MKVYVLSIDWASDGECEAVYGCGVREVYVGKEQALTALNNLIAEEYKNNSRLENYRVERTATEFVAGEDGNFTNEHFCAYVSEREIK